MDTQSILTFLTTPKGMMIAGGVLLIIILLFAAKKRKLKTRHGKDSSSAKSVQNVHVVNKKDAKKNKNTWK